MCEPTGHGAAMLDALDQPPIGALDLAIETLDAVDGDCDFEPDAGYDQPEGDDESCPSEHDGCEPEECAEPYLSVTEWEGRGCNWRLSDRQTGPFGCDLEQVEYEEAPRLPHPPAVYRSTNYGGAPELSSIAGRM